MGRPATVEGHRYRALDPGITADGVLLEVISRGEHTLHGFRNRDLRALLYPRTRSAEQARRDAAAVTRRLRLLRAHGLIKKVSGTQCRVMIDRGRSIVTALLVARQADIDQLTQLAA